jgi:hypothetical protein
MFKTSVFYNDEYLEETVKRIEDFDANFGGTEIVNPLLDIINNEKEMKDYNRHVILLTDGQVSNSDQVIKVIAKMKNSKIATTHVIGIGNGVSFDMIRRGAIEGGGEHLFIMNNKEMKRQIIFLLESITSCQITNFTVKYDEKVFHSSYPLIPNVLKKGMENSFFLRLRSPLSSEEIALQKIEVSYFDEENESPEKLAIKLSTDTLLPALNKYSVKLEIENLSQEGT